MTALRRLALPALLAVLAASAVASEAPRSPSSEDAIPPSQAIPPARPSPGDLQDRIEFRNRIAEMLDAVQAHHVDEALDPQEVIHGAIRGMLDTLDPHTHFLDSDAYRAMREGQDGSFFGLGIIISVRRDSEGKNRLTVISPIDGMPAKRLGMRPGDIIAAIDGSATDDMTLDEAVGKLRGRKGTTVLITIEREEERFDLTVERAEIPTESVPHAYMIEPGTGFVRIKDFTKTTTRELADAMRRLRAQGMERMVLDLRDNPGGLLDEAVSVSSLFLDDGAMVVETRGRVPGSTESRRTVEEAGRLPAEVPLIVLVNRGSASASEIVSGAIQDHDRGLVVGGTTWGKGLVQSVYSISDDSGLALTTARYYTPSGRQIQRDYRSSYYDYYMPRKDSSPHGEEHVTQGGRRVYSGGGIQPDVLVDEEEPLKLTARLVARALPFRFAGRHLDRKPGTVKVGHALTREDVAEFRAFVESDGSVKFTDEEWTAALPQIEVQLLHDIVNAHLGDKEAFKVLNARDRQVQAALSLWSHATREAILRDAKGGTTPVVSSPQSG